MPFFLIMNFPDYLTPDNLSIFRLFSALSIEFLLNLCHQATAVDK